MSDDISIEELCKPLSAKIMPKSALFNKDSTPKDNDDAFMKSRQGETKRVIEKARRRKK
jgi:hypothetical protein